MSSENISFLNIFGTPDNIKCLIEKRNLCYPKRF